MEVDGQIFNPRIPLFITPNRSMERFGSAKRQREAAIDAAIEMAIEAAKRRQAGEWANR